MVLADLGADVIKVEQPGKGDDTRTWGPPFWGPESAMFLALNRNKRSLTLDLKSEGVQREVLPRLIRSADVVVQTFRPEASRRLGLDSSTLIEAYPGLIVCDLSGYGSVGPRRDEPGYDPLLQAFSGLMSITGEADGEPVRVGTSIVDMGAGLWATIGILSAIADRERTRKGCVVAASLFETAMAWMPYQIVGYLATGNIPRRLGSELPQVAPYGAFSAKDGRMVIAIGNETLWKTFCEAIEGNHLFRHHKFQSNPDRVRHRTELRTAIESLLQPRTVDEWISRLHEHGIPCSRINTVAEAVVDEHTVASNLLQNSEHSEIPDLRLVGLPLLFDGDRPAIRRGPPKLGENSREILREIGIDAARFIRS